jgi:translation initiation factor IF-3
MALRHTFGRQSTTLLLNYTSAHVGRQGSIRIGGCGTSDLLSSSSRSFASSKKPQPLTNEKLVQRLVRKFRRPATEVQVRMVIDPPEESKVVSLADAIKRSSELYKDLIEISIDQDIPVIRVEDLKKLEYQQSRKAQVKGPVKDKEFRFKGGIAENDFQRKVDQITQSLEKGLNCLVRIIIRRYMVTNDPDFAQGVATQVLERIGDAGELMNAVKINPTRTTAQFRLQPGKKKTKKS